MTKRAVKNVAASVMERLHKRMSQTGENFQFLLQRYAAERFLFRLGKSPHRNRYILKGAMLFALWGGSIYRPTRDLDFTGYGSPDPNDVIVAIREICEVPVDDDGLQFETTNITAEPIRDESEYHGLRVHFRAMLGNTRIPMQIDIGFGNAIQPSAGDVEYPTLLNGEPPIIKAYPQEAVVAEKLHGLVVHGEATSRMKDLYDLYTIAGQFSFDGSTLADSVRATFQRRSTDFAVELPAGLTSRFYSDESRNVQWRAYLNKNQLPGATSDLAQIGTRIISFLSPVWEALATGLPFQLFWQAESWQEVKRGKNQNA